MDEGKYGKGLAQEKLKEILLLIPNYLKLLYRLIQDNRVPRQEKALLLGTIAYVLSPVDFMPDFIPFVGQIDDILLVALILKRFMNTVERNVLLNYWDGSYDLLLSIERVLSYARFFLPKNVYERIVKKAQEDVVVDAQFEVKE